MYICEILQKTNHQIIILDKIVKFVAIKLLHCTNNNSKKSKAQKTILKVYLVV